EICFVPDGDHAALVERLGGALQDGDVIDESGQVLGHHSGVHRFTVGQRRGLGVAQPEPLYVLRLDAAARKVVVGPAKALPRGEMGVGDVRWTGGVTPSQAVRAKVQIRYRHSAQPARVEPMANGSARVVFDVAQRAIAPGQAAVFYQDDAVLGGGWIQ